MKKRSITLDTETTGLDPRQGHRVVEIGCVELIDNIRTSNIFHVYINPERDMPQDAYAIHGISSEFLSDKPLFASIYEDFFKFIDGAELIIHNAAFDLKFLNSEFNRLGKPPIDGNFVIDTLEVARRKYPGGKASLDELCKRFGIDRSKRTKHGALLDADLLASVYIEMTIGTQGDMLSTLTAAKTAKPTMYKPKAKINHEPLPRRIFPISEEELEAHRAFFRKIKNPLWEKVKENYQ